MSGLETAIRNALEKSDRASAEVRARIYQSARQALENGLRKQGVDDPRAVARQRQLLETIIRDVENSERDRLDAMEAPAVTVVPDARGAHPRADDAVPGAFSPEPDIDAPGPRPGSAQADLHEDHGGIAGLRADERRPERIAAPGGRKRRGKAVEAFPGAPVRKRRRGFVTRLFIYSIFLVFLGMGAWWIQTSGILLSASERDTSVPNPPATIEEEDFTGREPAQAPEPGRGFSDDWLEVFNATRDAASLRASGGASQSGVATSTGPAIRVSVGSGVGRVSIPVPASALREMAGKSSTIAVTMRSSSEKHVEISISCDFSTLGKCSRHRFTATPEKTDALFRASFDRSLAPNNPGQLLVDIDGADGSPVDIYSVRILPGQ